MKRAFLLNGPGKSGKNTFIKLCRLYFKEHKIPVYSFSSIFPIKDYIFKSGQWDGITKDDEARTLMVQTKQDMIADNDKPLSYCLDAFRKHPKGVFFFHAREPEEIAKMVRAFDEEVDEELKTIHLERRDPELVEFNSGVDLKKETLRYKEYDHYIENHKVGLEHFALLVRSFLKKEFPDYEFGAIALEDLEDKAKHKRFDDEMNAGYA